MVSCRPGRAAGTCEIKSMARTSVSTSRGRPRQLQMLSSHSRCATRARVSRCRVAHGYAENDVDSLGFAPELLPFNCRLALGPSRSVVGSETQVRSSKQMSSAMGRGSVFEYSSAAGCILIQNERGGPQHAQKMGVGEACVWCFCVVSRMRWLKPFVYATNDKKER